MNRFNLVLLAIAASVVASFAASPPAVAQPAATKQMQDAQRKAEQKAREARKKSERQAGSHKRENEKPASAP